MTGRGDRALTITNPVIFADVPDPDVVHDGRHYYMVSTTMYFAPSVPIMRSSDLVHWSIVGYTGPILDDTDALALRNGENAYGQGTWAASIRHHEGTFYVSVGSLTTQKTYVYATPRIEHGPWTRSVLDGYAHDQSLLFDDEDAYLVYGSGVIDLRRLGRDDSGTFVWDGPATRLVEDADVDQTSGLSAEGAHAYKIGDHYYVFMIQWPTDGIRQEVVWRSTSLTPQSQGGTWEGRVVLSQAVSVEGRQGDGVAQGGVVQAADGQWYAMLFQDEGPLGRSPQLARVTWDEDGWPVYELDSGMAVRPGAPSAGATGLLVSDDFDNQPTPAGYWNTSDSGDLTASDENAWNFSSLGLSWQWNHNPDNRFWSLTERPGHLRLTTGSIASGILDARNTLTQRTCGPTSAAAISLDVSAMRDGDVAGLSAYQQKYGYVAVEMAEGARRLVMRRADRQGRVAFTSAPVPLTAETVLLRVDVDFRDAADRATFAYSLDGAAWSPIGDDLAMEYSLDHFTGYRFAIFCYATAETGGHVDVDWFRVGDDIDGRGPSAHHREVPGGDGPQEAPRGPEEISMPQEVHALDELRVDGATPSDAPLNHVWNQCVGAGRANEALRADWQAQFREAVDVLGVRFVRFHGLFHDDMFVYRATYGGGFAPPEVLPEARITFSYVDMVFDAILDAGARPFVELGFMPRELATQTETLFWWKAHCSPPTDMGEWVRLVSETVRHWIERYGLDEVRQWRFEVWNEPNLVPHFWTGTRTEYFELYEATARALKAIDPQLKVGGPSTSVFVPDARYAGETYDRAAEFATGRAPDPDALDWQPVWVRELIDYCAERDLPVDFLSTHLYPTDYAADGTGSGFTAIHRHVDATEQDLRLMQELIAASPYPDAELHITEWSSSPSSRDRTHDTLFAATYITRAFLKGAALADSISYWTFTDIFEEGGAGLGPFHGGFGFVNEQGIHKPTFHAVAMLNRLGDRVVHQDEQGIITRSSDDGRVSAVFLNYPAEMGTRGVEQHDSYAAARLYKEIGTARRVRHTVAGLEPGTVFQVELLDWEHGNAAEAWHQMGEPLNLTRAQTAELKAIADDLRRWTLPVPESGVLEIDIDLPAWAVASVAPVASTAVVGDETGTVHA